MAANKSAAAAKKGPGKGKPRDGAKTAKVSAKKGPTKREKRGKKDTEVAQIVERGDESDNDQVDEEDVDFVRENMGSLTFLSSVNPESLANIKKEPKVKRPGRGAKPAVPKPAELSDTDDDGDNSSVGGDFAGEDSGSDLEVLSGDEQSGDELEEQDQPIDIVLSQSDVSDESDSESMSEEGDDGDDDVEDGKDDDDQDYSNSKARRALKRKTMFGGEMDYERDGRAFAQAGKRAKPSSKLPIKTADGRLVLADGSDDEAGGRPEDEDSDDDDDGGSASDAGDGSDSGPAAAAATAAEGVAEYGNVLPDRGQMTRKQYIVAQQNRLAAVADKAMQEPEEGLGHLKTLREISEDEDVKVQQLGLLTQLAVYCDILPEYRIRELTDKEKESKVTKAVQQQRMYEESLVRNYSQFLKQLFAATKRAVKVFGDESADVATGTVAARALGVLINARPHFNFRKDILAALVDVYVQPTSRINFARFTPMAQTARLAILRLFRNDASGELSQNAVTLAAQRIKRLSYRVDPSVLRPWLHLRLREELRENPEDRKRAEEDQKRKEEQREKKKLLRRKRGGAALKEAKRALHVSKKQAKAAKVQKEVDRSLREAEAEVTREEREKWYGETLKQVFVTYFRILKQRDNIGGLLPAVLEGLARYAHLISVEFFVDLFQLLKKIMRGQHGVGVGAEETQEDDLVSPRVGLRTSLLCILTALHILTGQGEALNLDIKDFFHQLYALLPPLAAAPQIEATRISALSDGTRYTVYLGPAEVAAANAAVRGAAPASGGGAASGPEAAAAGLDNEGAAWEETVRSEADLLFECLQLMFLGRTKVASVTRVAAFCKRIAEGALHWPPRTAVRAIELLHRLLIKYPTLDCLLSSDEQAGSGLYLRDLDDPDMCNPMATCLFELHWLQIHHHPAVQAAAARLLGFARAEAKRHRM